MNVRFSNDIETEQKKKKSKFNFNFAWLKNPSSLFYYFLLLLVISFAFYFIMLINNGFIINYSGDFGAQYIPMAYHVWDYWHELLSTGHAAMFDESVYLGASTLGSDAYYGLYSPFNILIVMFPRNATLFMMSFASMLKIACAGLIFRAYIKYLGCKESTARLAGFAYAFIGWMAFYLWYNNYQDIFVFFPLVLLGVDKVIRERKPWILAIGIALLAISNYVLMISYIICAAIYALFRFFQRIKLNNAKYNWSALGIGVAAALVGVLLAGLVFVPAFAATINSPKVGNNSYLHNIKVAFESGDLRKAFGYIFSWNYAPDQHNRVLGYRVYYPIINFFVPTTTCRSMTSLQLTAWDFDDVAVSLWVYVPFIIFLVPAVIQSIKDKKISHVLAIAFFLFALFTPIMYYALMGFTNCYARWTLFVGTSLLAYVALYIDRIPNVNKIYVHFGYGFAILGIVACWILTETLPNKYIELSKRFIYNNFDYTPIVFVVLLVYVTLVYFIILKKYNSKKLATILMGFVAFEAAIMGNIVTFGQGYDTTYNNGWNENYQLYDIISNIKKDDSNFYRYYTALNDAYSVENTLMNNYSSGSYFHSLYNFNVDYFTRWADMRSGQTAVGGKYRNKIQDLDALMAVKYYIIDKREGRTKADKIESIYPGNYRANVPLSFEKAEKYETTNYSTYINNDAPTIGYSYDTVYAYNSYQEEGFSKIYTGYINAVENGRIMLTNGVLSYDDTQTVFKEAKHGEQADISISTKSTSELYYTDSTLHQLSVDGYYSSTHASYPYEIKFYNTDNIFSKFYDIAKITSIPDELEQVAFKDVDPMKYFAFVTKKDGTTFDDFDNGESLYIYAPFTGSRKYDIYLIDENNKIFTYDDHDDHSTDNNSYIRGFYTKDKKIKAIAYCGKYGESNDILKFWTEKGSDYKARIDTQKEYPFTDVTYNKEVYKFKTNWNKQRLVVTKVAYDKGWSVYATVDGKQTQLPTYIGNGGFVSFVTPNTTNASDKTVTYEMKYVTPYSGGGHLLAGLATGAFMISLIAYQYHVFNKKLEEEISKLSAAL